MNLSRPFIRRPIASGLIAVALVLVALGAGACECTTREVA